MAVLLVYSEKIETARELVAGGKELAAALGLGVSAVALGPGAGAAASELAAAGADTVYVSEDAAFEGWPADAVAAGLAQIADMAGADRRARRLHAARQGDGAAAGAEARRRLRHRRQRASWPRTATSSPRATPSAAPPWRARSSRRRSRCSP